MPEWSEQQRLAFSTFDRSLLVSAAAGSGKTATLSKRCVYLTCEAPEPCDITELLVVTYTEAAAAEMRSRIGKELRELESLAEIAGNSGQLARVRRQLALLPGAQISTLHAFCAKLIRRHFQTVRLDPDFRVMDEHEAALLKQELIAELFEEAFQLGAVSDFTRLIDLYGDGSDSRIETRVIHAHDMQRSLLDAAGWRRDALSLLQEVQEKPRFLDSVIGRRYQKFLLQQIEDLLEHGRQVILALSKIPDAETFISVAEAICASLPELAGQVERGEWKSACEALEDIVPTRARAQCADKDLCDRLLNGLREPLKTGGAIHAALQRDPDDRRSEIISTIPSASTFLDLIDRFSHRYQEAKRRQHAADFADLEHFSLDLLRAPDGRVASECRQRFAGVMVDEFQDVNEVQWTILKLVSRCDSASEISNLFCVGDVKQSIYRFRMADPAIFLQRERDAEPRGQLVSMRHNFRSRGPLLEAINFTFHHLMQSESAAELIYAKKHHLDPRRQFPAASDGKNFSGAPIELHVITDGAPEEAAHEEGSPSTDEIDMDRVEREARYVASWIQKLMSEGRQVLDRSGDYRPLRYGDIAILLRSARYSAIEYSRALSELSIPCFAESRTGFFQATETSDLISVLRLLDNQQQDIPMAALLRSPNAELPEPENALARIRLAYRDAPFHEAVVKYASEHTDAIAASIKATLDRLSQWRKSALMLSVADLLWQILSQTGYLAYCRALPNGRQRVANVLFLHRCARKFAGFQRQGLFRFIQFLNELEENSDLGQPSPGEAGNAVQVMTIHGSKGLEFPVVIVSDIGKRFNLQDAAGCILADRKNHLGIAAANEEHCVRYPTAASEIVRDAITTASKAEELRVLYVAMTRAQESLLLVGSTSDAMLQYLRHKSSPGADPRVFRSARSFMDWLVPLTSLDKTAAHLKLITVPASDIVKPPRPLLSETTDQPLGDTAGLPIEMISFRYGHELQTITPAATSVTGLSKHNEVPADLEFDPAEVNDASAAGAWEYGADVAADAADIAQTPAASELFAGDESQSEAAIRGIAMHRFMEHIDLSQKLDGQLDALIAAGHLTAEEAKRLEVADIRWVLEQSPVADLLHRHAGTIVRELPLLHSIAEDSAADPLDHVMLRGRIDAVIPADEGLIVIDYKTDRTFPAPGSPRELAYRKQMDLYRQALASSGLGKVAGIRLVFLHARRVMEC